ncbi:beta-N-acetylhexosaminidase [Paenibacillus donghaensis]|uniref:beta-N-acetylhexosaminidase n=1 Tax=Paenibacillus donghaensis TaxID=414771 RepID=A0A2Z2K845_9BACL|nr:beta-N-acetylhexosaminidase [Paenibacillus donghaensis]ASA21404.1 beta-N-acetylhexosaminidase [Paenibacillus donghaensis]
MKRTPYVILKTHHTRPYAAAAAILCTLLVAGCGSGGNAQSASPAPPAASTAPSASAPAQQQDSTPLPSASPAAAATAEADPLALKVSAMSLPDKIGQMLLVGIDGTTLDDTAKRMIAEDKVGGIILYKDNINNLKGLVSLVNDLRSSNAGSPAPLFLSVDQEGGKVSRMPSEFAALPSNRTVGAANDTAAAETMGQLLAKQVRAAGLNMDFAPVLDINSNPDNPVIGDRSFGSTAELVTRLGLAELKGFEDAGVIPVVKHFPGHGDTSVDSHLELPVVDKTQAQLAKLEWLPFQAAVDQQADVVMVAHILYPKLDPDRPASLSSAVIGGLLREDMGFRGVVITDDLTMGAITKNYKLGPAAVDTVNAGSDILLIAHGYDNERTVRNALLQGVENGTISIERIDQSVHRILALKQKYQLSDQPIEVPDLAALNKEIAAWRDKLKR